MILHGRKESFRVLVGRLERFTQVKGYDRRGFPKLKSYEEKETHVWFLNYICNRVYSRKGY